MRLKPESTISRTCQEIDIVNEQLTLDDKYILELGCGAAEITRLIATGGTNRRVLALEVDEIQYAKNLKTIKDLPNVEFRLAGAQAIPVKDSSVDVVFLFRSLHHIPVDLLKQSFCEIARVLKPNGYLYIEEPIYDGEFNEIMRIFEDEKVVREAAFDAIRTAVDSIHFELVNELFFNKTLSFPSFEDFERRVIGVSYMDRHLTPDQYAQVKARFEANLGESGAKFPQPHRVDLLRRTEF
jgi:SAM-dependent methyltransferase